MPAFSSLVLIKGSLWSVNDGKSKGPFAGFQEGGIYRRGVTRKPNYAIIIPQNPSQVQETWTVSDSTKMQDQNKPTPSVPDQDRAASGTLQTITRLLVGGALMGGNILQKQLESWDRELASSESKDDEGLTEPGGVASTATGQPEQPETLSEQTQYALIGLLFQSQTYLQKGAKTLDRAERAAWTLMTPVHKPLGTWRVFAPARKRYARLAARGEAEIDRWVQLGRIEAQRSQTFTASAIDNTVDESIDFVVTSPQVREVIKDASTSLGGEVGDAVRSRTVSSDTLVEGLARRIFQRPPREFPPEPPITREMLEQDRSRGE